MKKYETTEWDRKYAEAKTRKYIPTPKTQTQPLTQWDIEYQARAARFARLNSK